MWNITTPIYHFFCEDYYTFQNVIVGAWRTGTVNSVCLVYFGATNGSNVSAHFCVLQGVSVYRNITLLLLKTLYLPKEKDGQRVCSSDRLLFFFASTILNGCRYLLLQSCELLRKFFHITAYFVVGYLRIYLCGLYVRMSQYTADRFYRHTLC